MLAVDRRLKILETVAEEQTIQVVELAARFQVSEMTIRRDIKRLERDGFLRRTYGGATAHLTRSLDLAFNARALQSAREKRLIGMAAAGLVSEAASLFIGIGTTCEQFGRYIRARPDLTVVTGSLPIASQLGTRSMHTVVLGGSVRRDELSCVGPAARATLGRYRFDVAVIGAAGLSVEAGITDMVDEEADIHREAIALARRVIVLADASKLGQVALTNVAPATAISVLVTDAGADTLQLQRFRDLGIEIVLATAPLASGSLAVDAQQEEPA
jgi:DeoR family transcriptional regulator, fructose operon transcriptional repressor